MALQVSIASPGHKGKFVIDVRPQVGHSVFTAPIDLVIERMNGRISSVDFVKGYLEFLNTSVQENPKVWVTTLRQYRAILAGPAHASEILALFMTKMGASFLETQQPVLSSEERVMIIDFAITPLKNEPIGKMVVDPLAINTIQSSTCRTCRDNRVASARTRDGVVTYAFVEKNQKDDQLATRNASCCSNQAGAEGTVYHCPIFSYLIEGYKAGVTSQGTNLNPCKNCTEYMDNGGNCIGDRCPDGTFDIIPGSGLVRS